MILVSPTTKCKYNYYNYYQWTFAFYCQVILSPL